MANERSSLVAIIAVLLLLSNMAAGANDKISVETFGALPPYASITLSADGSKAVALKSIGETYHVVLLDFESRKSKLLMAANPEEFLFNWCRFANDTRIVCSIRSYIILKAGTIGLGYRAYRDGRTVARRLLAIDIDGTNQIQLVPKAKSQVGRNLVWNAVAQDGVVSWMKDDPEHILIQLNRQDRTRPSVYKLNIYDNKMKRVRAFLPSVVRWYADDLGEFRFATGYTGLREPVAYTLENGKRKKVDINHLAGIDQPSLLALSPDDTSAWVLANNGKNTQGVHRVDLTTGKVLQTLFEHDEYDARRLLVHPGTREPILLSYQAEHEEIVWFDESVEAHVRAIRVATGDPKYVRIGSMTDNLSHMIVRTEGNGTHPSQYLYTFADRSMVKLSQWQQGEPVEFQSVVYKTRDGLDISAYLALPGPINKGPYPTVIRPHGGPWARDTDKQYFITQFLVNRGYAVLKPNFRGSTGYGDNFTRRGFEQWGMEMQDDIIDGLDWMIESGFTDPDRVCIAGGSYGGYVSLVAAYKTPDRFKCAVSFAGVADLADLVSRWYLYEFGRLSTARVPKGAAMEANSPIKHVDEFGIPVLLIHGDVDTTVVVDQSRDLAAALQEAGKPYQYIEQRNGDHYYSLQSHRLEYLQALESFLRAHLH